MGQTERQLDRIVRLSRDENPIQVDRYEQGNRAVFSVHKGDRNWECLDVEQSDGSAAWKEKKTEGPDMAVSRKRRRWLEDIRRNRKNYPRIIRFPRTHQHEQSKHLVGSIEEAFKTGDNTKLLEDLSKLQCNVSAALAQANGRRGELVWRSLPRFDPAQVKDTKWLIEFFLAEKSIQLIYAEAGSFKTTLCLFCAKAVAAGEPILGKKTLQRRVIYIDFENPSGVIKDRCVDLDLDLPNNPNLMIWDRVLRDPPLPNTPSGDRQLEQIVRDCVAETGYGPWIVFDSWASMLKRGDGGESTGQVAPVFIKLRKLVDLGATITVLDHSKKYDNGTVYGGADKEAKSDTIHNLQANDDEDNPQERIVTVDSRLKRYAPFGIGSFAFVVKSKLDDKQKWHISKVQITAHPAEAMAQKNIGLLSQLIRENPDAGQEELADLAKKSGLARDQATKLLKAGTSKHWTVTRVGRRKLSYQLL